MRKFTIVSSLLLLTATLGLHARSQDAPKPSETPKPPDPLAHYYHLEYVIQEIGVDGKPVNSRSYSTVVGTDRHEQFSGQLELRFHSPQGNPISQISAR